MGEPEEETKDTEKAEETETPAAEAAPEEEKKEDAASRKKRKEPEKRYEWVDVVKKKRRIKRTDISVVASGRPGLDDATLQKRQDEETAMQVEMRDIIETDERRNDLESYIFSMRDKTSSSGEYGEFISDADREKFSSELMKAEDWLYDTVDASKLQFIDKLSELKSTGNVVACRFKEAGMRSDWIEAVAGTIRNYRLALENGGEKYGHIAPEKLESISTACTDLENWLTTMKSKQEKTPKYEKPPLLCADMERKNQELAKMADEILKEPKPAPVKEK